MNRLCVARSRSTVVIGDQLADLGLLTHTDDSPVRLRANGRRHRPVGLYFSLKSGRHLPHESTLELHDLWHAEVRTDVVSAWPQPFTLQFVMDGVVRRYTPDRKDLLCDGCVEVVEVKDELAALRDPSYARKLEAAAELLAQRGMSFVLRERAEIQAEPLFSAVEAVQRHRRTRITAGDAVRAEQVLAAGPVTLGELVAAFGGGAQGLAVVCALMVRRTLRIDLQDGLNDSARVERVA